MPVAVSRSVSESHDGRMSKLTRRTLVFGGVFSWVAGAGATFAGGEGSGAVALIAAGATAGLLGLVGRWPSRIAVSGNEISWAEVKETVEEQIDAAEDAGNESAVQELEELRRRLDALERTGSAPRHPAAAFDDAVEQAIRRALPGAVVRRAEGGRSRAKADFEVALGARALLVESKFKSDPRHPFQGTTLTPLLASLSRNERLLIVTNAIDTRRAEEVVADRRDRVRLVSWIGPADDQALSAALINLLRDSS